MRMLAYVNGEFVEDDDAKVSVRDRGFMLGDAVFEVWRTYGGSTCERMVEKNLARLAHGLRYMELDPESVVPTVKDVGEALIERNADEIAARGDSLVFTIVSRGFVDELAGDQGGAPSIVMFLNTIPRRSGAQAGDDLYGKGARVVTSLMYRDPFGAVDPRIKTTSRFAYARAERKMSRSGPRTWVLFCDNDGNPTECSGASLFIVKDGALVRPPRERVLGGINMTMFLELAQELGIPVEERTLTLYDFLNADEVILTTTSVGAVHVSELDGIRLTVRSDVYQRVLKRWFELVDFDFVHGAREREGLLTPGA
jgi:branched-chain amino acid aminotransferase